MVVSAHQHVKVVLQCAHPRRHFFFLGAGQEADVFAHWHRDAGHDDLVVDLLVER